MKLAHINSDSETGTQADRPSIELSLETEALLEQRRQQALKSAEECISILKQEFGATEIIVFRSLRGDAPWHWRSDLDLAVRGMSDKAIWDAYGKIEKVRKLARDAAASSRRSWWR